jgi:uncharacterized iron-regulated membrane protein
MEDGAVNHAGEAKKSRRWNLRAVHRSLAIFALLFISYLGVTGSMLQIIDMHTLFKHKPATNPEMLSIRESLFGPRNYSVIEGTDYDAQPLPENFDFDGAMSTALKAAGSSTTRDLRYIEFRTEGARPVVVLHSEKAAHFFDANTGAVAPEPPQLRETATDSLRQQVKLWHILRVIGNWMAWLHLLTATSMFVLIVTGIWLYFRMLVARSRGGRRSLFWGGGGVWRAMHRWVSITAAILLLWVAGTGMLLSVDQFSIGMYQLRHHGETGPFARFPPGTVKDYSAPVDTTKLPAEIAIVLTAFHAQNPGLPIKVLRLRSFAGMQQGVFIAGLDDHTTQTAYNAETGEHVTSSEPGYPKTQYPFGWEEHELMKQLHRGDYFGVPGRMLDLYAGLAMIYLSLSGLVMYVDMWRRRRLSCRGEIVWT